MPTRYLAWPTCFNARDLGGHRGRNGRQTRRGALVRADNMAHLSAEGQAALVAHGVRTVIDLLSQSEHDYEPRHPFVGNVAADAVPCYRPVPLIDERDAETTRLVDDAPTRLAAYQLMLDRCQGQIAAAVRAVADAPPGGVLFHCHSGTDRTGLVAALLLAVAGVPTEAIVEEYTLSHEPLGAFYEHYLAQVVDPEARAHFQRITAPADLIASALAHLDAAHGGPEPYLRAAGLADGDFARLRARLLDD